MWLIQLWLQCIKITAVAITICILYKYADPRDTPDGRFSKAQASAMRIPEEYLSFYPYSEIITQAHH